jgi:hypothetical protein
MISSGMDLQMMHACIPNTFQYIQDASLLQPLSYKHHLPNKPITTNYFLKIQNWHSHCSCMHEVAMLIIGGLGCKIGAKRLCTYVVHMWLVHILWS